jgi:hypothetical protein
MLLFPVGVCGADRHLGEGSATSRTNANTNANGGRREGASSFLSHEQGRQDLMRSCNVPINRHLLWGGQIRVGIVCHRPEMRGMRTDLGLLSLFG